MLFPCLHSSSVKHPVLRWCIPSLPLKTLYITVALPVVTVGKCKGYQLRNNFLTMCLAYRKHNIQKCQGVRWSKVWYTRGCDKNIYTVYTWEMRKLHYCNQKAWSAFLTKIDWNTFYYFLTQQFTHTQYVYIYILLQTFLVLIIQLT